MNQSAIKAIKKCSKSVTSIAERDFFGISGVTNKDIAGGSKIKLKLSRKQLVSKYQELVIKRNALANEEQETNAVYGTIRFDVDNTAVSHGQYEPDNEQKKFDTIEIKQKFMPINETASQQISNEETITIEPQENHNEIDNYSEPKNIVEIRPELSISDALKLFKDSSKFSEIGRYNNTPPLTFFFQDTKEFKEKKKLDDVSDDSQLDVKLSGCQANELDLDKTIVEATVIVDKKPPLNYDPKKDVPPVLELDPDSFEYHERIMEKDKELEWDSSLDEPYKIKKDNYDQDKPKNALEYLKAVRAKKVQPKTKVLKQRIETNDPYSISMAMKLDSQGFNNYENQTPKWWSFRRVEVLRYLKRSIIYNNYGVLALNKPYGLPSHNEQNDQKTFDINDLMQDLAKELRYEKLYLAHRLDKTTTGILLFATEQKRADHLNKLFKADKIQKVYWCLTNRIPRPNAGIIDIPIGINNINGKNRSCLCPEDIDPKHQLSDRFREARRAVTEYKVLSETQHVALVEARPRSGVKHQIRCHLGLGLGTPILGDHKYSHVAKLVPQQLPQPVLKLLNLRQPKVRTLPTHLHAKSIIIPEVKANGETLFINAPLPNHFRENMKKLKIPISEV